MASWRSVAQRGAQLVAGRPRGSQPASLARKRFITCQLNERPADHINSTRKWQRPTWQDAWAVNCWKVLTGQGARSALVAFCLGTNEPAGLRTNSGVRAWQGWEAGEEQQGMWATAIGSSSAFPGGPRPRRRCMQPAGQVRLTIGCTTPGHSRLGRSCRRGRPGTFSAASCKPAYSTWARRVCWALTPMATNLLPL